MKLPFRVRSSSNNWLMSYADLVTNLLIFFVLIISASSLQKGKLDRIVEYISQKKTGQSLSDLEIKVKDMVEQQNLQQQITVDLTDNGLEIVFDSGVIFESGSAAVLPKMEEPLKNVLNTIKPLVGKYRIAVEGHTDERPMSSKQYRSNWELSSARALAIRSHMEQIDVDPQFLQVEAYANYKPLDKNKWKDLSHEQWLAKNRRVVIRLF